MEYDNELLFELLNITDKAGDILLPFFYGNHEIEISYKPDNTPCTEADKKADIFLSQALSHLIPSYPILSEESQHAPFSERSHWDEYWLLDPLDGTRGFINNINEFCISVALIKQHEPVIGVLHAPAMKQSYVAIKGQSAFSIIDNQWRPLKTTPMHKDKLRLIVSHFANKEKMSYWQTITHADVHYMTSAMKFGVIAEGLADCYPRLGPTSEWDTAAGQCILEAAGGAVLDFSGKSLQYNTRDSLVNPSFIAIGDVNQLDFIISTINIIRGKK